MTEFGAANGLVKGEEARVENNNNNDDEKNVVTLQLEDFGEKVGGKVTIDTRENWMSEFLYGGPLGLTINFGLLIGITLHFALTIGAKLEDDYYFENYFMQIWLRQICEFWFFLVPLHFAYAALLVFVLFPLSRLSRSTGYYWFLGLSMLIPMFALLFTKHLFHVEITTIMGLEACLDWVRVAMMMCSFLVECNRSKEVFDKSSMKTLAYFYFIPCLVYKHEYPRARAIRWIRVLSRFWWLLVVAIPGYAVALPYIHYLLFDIYTISARSSIIVAVVLGLYTSFEYGFVSHFVIFENFCGLHAELLRYPDQYHFGSLIQIFSGSRGPAHLNLVASRWLKKYAFVPVLKTTDSRLKAAFFAFALSLIFHDIVVFYATGILLTHITIITVIGLSVGITVKAPNRYLAVLQGLFLGQVIYMLSASYRLEFLAWYYSSAPDIEAERRLRLVPLFVEIITKRITDALSS